MAQLLRPIKNAILLLEGNQTNLADAFIQMIRLAYLIKRCNAGAFQQHAIKYLIKDGKNLMLIYIC